MLWLASQAELEAEQRQMAEAMDISMREAEAQRAKEKPLKEWPQEQLAARFIASAFLLEVSSCCT